MGFVEVYIVFMLVSNFGFACYYTGIGAYPDYIRREHPMFSVICRWIVILPLVGRIFGWW